MWVCVRERERDFLRVCVSVTRRRSDMQFNLDGHVCGVRMCGVRVGVSRQASHRASDSGNSNKPGI